MPETFKLQISPDDTYFIVEMLHVNDVLRYGNYFTGKVTQDWKHYFKFYVKEGEEVFLSKILDIFKGYKDFAEAFDKYEHFSRLLSNPPQSKITFAALMELGSLSNHYPLQ
jgi:hypothetical protein